MDIEDRTTMQTLVPPEKLNKGEISILGKMANASNASLLVEIKIEVSIDSRNSEEFIKAIYKPIAGESPLWDFPDGNLASREYLAYLISEWGDFNCVPPTVLREGPFGFGSVQQWIEIDGIEDFNEIATSLEPKFRNLVLYDAVINNADRKFGHILPIGDDIYGCDHGPTFHVENKLRTVLWQFRGMHLESSEIQKLEVLQEVILQAENSELIAELITNAEIDALHERIEKLRKLKVFPEPSEEWPAIPWPPV